MKLNFNWWFTKAYALSVFLIIVIFYKKILFATILVLLLSIITLIKWKSRRTLMVFISGGIGGTILEMIAIKIGVWNYTITNLLNVPWWLFLAWGGAAAVIYQSALEYKERKLNLK